MKIISDLYRTLLSFFRTEGGLEGKQISTPGDSPISGNRRIYPKTDGWYEQDASGVERKISIRETVTQTTHGFSVGNVIRRTSGSYVKAQADSLDNAEIAGIVESVTSADIFTFVLPGGKIAGLSSLTDGATYFLDASTAGAMTTTAPAISKPVLNATSTTTGIVLGMRAISTGSTNLSCVDIPIADIVGGRLDYSSDTSIKWSFLKSNELAIWDGSKWIVVACATEPTASNSGNDIGGTAKTYSKIYDIFAVYSNTTSFTIDNFAPWGYTLYTAWVTSTAYVVGDTVSNSGVNYKCVIAHTSGTFSTDLTNSKWQNAQNLYPTRYATWVTSTAYKIGDRVVNSGSYYACILTHTSGTFATDLSNGKWKLLNGTGNLIGLDIKDGVPIYADSGDYAKYRFLGVVWMYNDSGAKFKWGQTGSLSRADSGTQVQDQRSIGNYYNKKAVNVMGKASSGSNNGLTNTYYGYFKSWDAPGISFVLAESQSAIFANNRIIQNSFTNGWKGETIVCFNSTLNSDFDLMNIAGVYPQMGISNGGVAATLLGLGFNYIDSLAKNADNSNEAVWQGDTKISGVVWL